MKKVEILMSSYNGEKVIARQIKSIMAQKDVDIALIIRDDGSDDKTCEIIERLSEKYDDKITLIRGNNIGWKKSFLELLQLAGSSDYYGFSDQDDYWFPEKVIKSVDKLEKELYQGVKLVQTNSLCTNENLKKSEEQQVRYPEPKNRKSVIAQEYFQGCSMLWNSKAMEMIKKYRPTEDLAHDFWVGTLCYYIGKTYYIETPLFYHVRYDTNSSTDGNVFAGRRKRILRILAGGTIYMNPSRDLLKGYSEYLNKEDKRFLQEVCKSKENIFLRIKLTLSHSFVREEIMSTILFKLLFLLGKY